MIRDMLEYMSRSNPIQKDFNIIKIYIYIYSSFCFGMRYSMAGQPWKVGDFELMYYKCVSGVKRDIIVRRVPGPKLIIWRMFQSPDERSVLVEFR